MLSNKIDMVVVGGEQAGLAISYHLSQEGREHVVLERVRAMANAWRNQRWDSFTLREQAKAIGEGWKTNPIPAHILGVRSNRVINLPDSLAFGAD
jgi:putative flavoprotein involved in K+ transport